MKWNKENVVTFFKTKGFYIVASLCLVAVGVASYSAYSGVQNNLGVENESSANSIVSEIESNVNDAIPSVQEKTKTETTSEAVTSKNKPSAVSAKVADNFIIPVHGDIIKKFSKEELTYSKTLNDLRLHPAIDIACEKDTEVNAAGKGTVTEIASDTFSGSVIVIDHGNGLVIRYVGVKPAENIKKGSTVTEETVLGVYQEIPYESADEPHIHIEVLKNNEFISPYEVLGIEE